MLTKIFWPENYLRKETESILIPDEIKRKEMSIDELIKIRKELRDIAELLGLEIETLTFEIQGRVK